MYILYVYVICMSELEDSKKESNIFIFLLLFVFSFGNQEMLDNIDIVKLKFIFNKMSLLSTSTLLIYSET